MARKGYIGTTLDTNTAKLMEQVKKEEGCRTYPEVIRRLLVVYRRAKEANRNNLMYYLRFWPAIFRIIVDNTYKALSLITHWRLRWGSRSGIHRTMSASQTS